VTDALADLRWRTPAAWIQTALSDPLALLADHAHLERAAAANALALVRRWPGGVDPNRWVQRLAGVARDETEHLALVTRELARRGGVLTRKHDSSYARALRDHVAVATAGELADRLFVSALIELRSYERFVLLAAAGHDLSPLYGGLQASEAGHHRLFVALARSCGGDEDRWSWWCDQEAAVAAAQPPGPRIHAGVATTGAATVGNSEDAP
jgi:tRNA 2-(methylsulfanyl)-N6-isopentenyladenosine37 hydroxylase